MSAASCDDPALLRRGQELNTVKVDVPDLDVQCFEITPPATRCAKALLSGIEAHASRMDDFEEFWSEMCRMHCHDKVPRLLEGRLLSSRTPCQIAGRCVCDRRKPMAEQRGRDFSAAFKALFVKGSPGRGIYSKQGACFALKCFDAGYEERMFFVGFGNLNTGVFGLLELEPVSQAPDPYLASLTLSGASLYYRK